MLYCVILGIAFIVKGLVSNKNGEINMPSKAISCSGKILNICACDQTSIGDCKIRIFSKRKA